MVHEIALKEHTVLYVYLKNITLVLLIFRLEYNNVNYRYNCVHIVTQSFTGMRSIL